MASSVDDLFGWVAAQEKELSAKAAKAAAGSPNAAKGSSADGDWWSGLWGKTIAPAVELAKADPKKASAYWTDSLKKSGLTAGYKPSFQTLEKVGPILVKMMQPADACLIIGWLGGAHDAAAPAFAATSFKLSAQYHCGESPEAVSAAKKGAAAAVGALQGAILGPVGAAAGAYAAWYGSDYAGVSAYRSVAGVLDQLAKVSTDLKNASELIKSAGTAGAKQSAKSQNKNANDDAIKLAKKALDVVTPEGFGTGLGIGVVAVVAVVVAIVYLKQ